MESNNQEVVRKMSLLVRLAVADKHFAGLEKDFIYRVGRNNGLSDQAIGHIIRHPNPAPSPLNAQTEEKLRFLRDCLGLVRADGMIRESEIIFFRSIAQRLGFRKDIVDRIIEIGDGETSIGDLKDYVG